MDSRGFGGLLETGFDFDVEAARQSRFHAEC